MGIECFFSGHNYAQDCERCLRCGKQRPGAHSWFVPANDPARHHCSTCGRYGPSVLELWPSCGCPVCARLRRARVGDLVERLSSANGKTYEKTRYQGGVYRYTEDPSEAATALAVLTHRLEHDIEAIDDVVLALVAQLGLVFINVEHACNSPTVREQVDCSQAIQLARQELVRRNGEAALAGLEPAPGIGVDAAGFGQPVAQWESAADVDFAADWPSQVLRGPAATARAEPGVIADEIRIERVDGIGGETPSLALCRSGQGVYWQGAYRDRLQYIDLALGTRLEAFDGDHVGHFVPLTGERVALTVAHSNLQFCDAGRPLDAVWAATEPASLMNGMLWVKHGGRLVLVGHAGPVCALATPKTDSHVRWAHSSRNLLLLAHRATDERDPTPWYHRPSWYELVELDESLGSSESRLILSESEQLGYGNFELGRDNELIYVELPKNDGVSDSSRAKIRRLNLDSLTSEAVLEEPRSVTYLHAGASGRLLWVERNATAEDRLMHFDPADGSCGAVLDFPHAPRWLQVDERWTRLVYYGGIGRQAELYNAALAPGLEPLEAIKAST